MTASKGLQKLTASDCRGLAKYGVKVVARNTDGGLIVTGGNPYPKKTPAKGKPKP